MCGCLIWFGIVRGFVCCVGDHEDWSQFVNQECGCELLLSSVNDGDKVVVVIIQDLEKEDFICNQSKRDSTNAMLFCP